MAVVRVCYKRDRKNNNNNTFLELDGPVLLGAKGFETEMGTDYICMHSYVCIIFIFVHSPSIDARTAYMHPHQSTTRYRRLSRTQRGAITMI